MYFTMSLYVFFVVLICHSLVLINCQLIVNVKDKGGDVLQESIYANTSTDTITLDFMKYDGTLITQFIDFPNEVQIFKAVVLGELERGKSGYQVMCFITRFTKNEFISSDAMSKLRQKKPGAVRNPEEDKGEEMFQLDLMVDMDHAGVISPHIAELCKDAKDAIYARDNDLKVLSRTLEKDYAVLVGATKRIPLYRMQRCRELGGGEMWRPCTCHYHSCVAWYPCGLKYCKGKDSSGKVVSYRCGIKTCRKCRLFEYYARQKQLCIWDEDYDLKMLDRETDKVPEEPGENLEQPGGNMEQREGNMEQPEGNMEQPGRNLEQPGRDIQPGVENLLEQPGDNMEQPRLKIADGQPDDEDKPQDL